MFSIWVFTYTRTLVEQCTVKFKWNKIQTPATSPNDIRFEHDREHFSATSSYIYSVQLNILYYGNFLNLQYIIPKWFNCCFWKQKDKSRTEKQTHGFIFTFLPLYSMSRGSLISITISLVYLIERSSKKIFISTLIFWLYLSRGDVERGNFLWMMA